MITDYNTTVSKASIICIWYPSGGFGHFVNAILSLYGKDYARPGVPLVFSSTGDSHSFPLMTPKYHHNPSDYKLPDLDPDLIYTVLIDNGIDDESTIYRNFFPAGKTVKLCYSHWSWPIVARTMIEKASSQCFSSEINADNDDWSVYENWAVREKYFLYLRDHPFRHMWKPSEFCHNIMIDDMLDYSALYNKLIPLGVNDSFFDDWQRWRLANAKYITPVDQACNIISQLDSKEYKEFSITDLWTQAVVNYYIWLKYGVEVPANDYSDWFTDTKQIVTMLNDQGAIV